MKPIRTLRFLAGIAALASVPALIAIAVHAEQKQVAPAAKPVATTQKAASDAAAPATGGTAAIALKDIAIGAPVFGSDGQKVGEVKGVKSQSTGAVQEIQIKTDGSPAKVVVIPGGRITKGGQSVQLALTSSEVGKLPSLADKKG